MSREQRLKNVNEFVKAIGDNGRQFFWNQTHQRYARMIEKNKRLYWADDYTGKQVYLHYPYWKRGFSHGGTLRQLVIELKEYVMTGKKLDHWRLGPWPETWCRGDPWGYGDGMEAVRSAARELGIVEEVDA